MILTSMYPGVNNSPQTTLTTAITADATTIPVADASVLPTGPNLATIGTESNAEVIRYASISGNNITGCERGFGGTTASVWPLDTPVYRAWTKYDYDTLIANINAVGNAVPDFSGLEGMVKVDEDGHLTDAVAGTDYQAPLTANVDYVTPDTFDAHVDNTTIHVTAEDKAKWNNPPEAPVQSVFGRTGAVVAETGDYTPEQVGAAPATHASQHASTGDDPVTPASIGAASTSHASTHAPDGSDPLTLDIVGGVLEDATSKDTIAGTDNLLILDADGAKKVVWSEVTESLGGTLAPAAHASTHGTGGSDPISPASIGAASTTHAPTHATNGSDPLSPSAIGASPVIKVTSISLPTASWAGDASPYSQVITVSGITNNSKIDLQPDATIISQLITDTVAGLYIVNDNTTVTAYAVNAKPTVDLTIQATITEVQS